MKNTLLIICLLIAIKGNAQLQNKGFYGDQQSDVCTNAVAFLDDPQVTQLITKMCDKMAIKNRYIIKSCGQVANCQAIMYQNKPYILYNTNFLQRVKGLNFSNATLPDGSVDWKTLTILAHELGHHVNLHLINPDPNMSFVDMELEADEFAGHMMRLLGASLAQTQAVMYESSVGQQDTYTHPGREKRLAALEKGYHLDNGPNPEPAKFNDQVIFTYGNYSICDSDFMKVYKRNYNGKDVDMSDTAISEYLKYYYLFCIKVKEAYKENINNTPKIQKELGDYQMAMGNLKGTRVYNELTKEYLEGIMLFELMDRNVWSRASKDTSGLKAFYDANKTKYVWGQETFAEARRSVISDYEGYLEKQWIEKLQGSYPLKVNQKVFDSLGL